MLIRLEQRPEPSAGMVYVSPVIAVVLTILTSMVMFALLGVDPVKAIVTFFIEPISSLDGVAELCVKATPLILIGVGLSLGFQANVWNIGAEGQLVIGALAGGGLGLAFFRPVQRLSRPGNAGLRRPRRYGLGRHPGLAQNPLQHQ